MKMRKRVTLITSFIRMLMLMARHIPLLLVSFPVIQFAHKLMPNTLSLSSTSRSHGMDSSAALCFVADQMIQITRT
jgi:hypothetical protein